jgi:hypothetical protein
MATSGIVLSKEKLEEPDISWRVWFAVFLSGFFTGAVLDLFALYLFARWFQR